MKKKTKLLNIEIDNLTMAELLEQYDSGILVTPNVDHLIKLQTDREFYEVYQEAEYIVLDSRILFLMMKFLRKPIKAVIPGSDLLPAFCRHHQANGDIKVFLLGAAPGVADQAMCRINDRMGREIIVGSHSPSFGFEKDNAECQDIVSIINKTDANVLAIGVGAPKQEKWLVRYFDALPKIKMAMAIGATIDFEAGSLHRAPKTMQKCGMEWLYRLLKEPKRLWRRYLIEDMPILKLLLIESFGLYRNPFAETNDPAE
jgi:N-acetylglucosaminyldiphosphoundecaprenol N-acetyl-beta-D-mannosaminyltransferase